MWQMRMMDPSGETRVFQLREDAHALLSSSSDEYSDFPLRDPTCLGTRLDIWRNQTEESSSPYWFRVAQGHAQVKLGDLLVREAHLPPGVALTVGETRFWIEAVKSQAALPTQPDWVRPWLTVSDSGRQLLWTSKKAAATSLSIYLAGETGTGKEVLAHLLHAWSERAAGQFVPLHCGALPLSLVESELFGHVKGAYTGAHQHRPGALLQAHGGTLFLDEIGDLPLDIQVKLLRFLENGEIRPVGADRTTRADVRLLCATHHPLKQLVEEGKFRRDLYYRLASITIDIPTLRSRPEDVQLLACQFATEMGRSLSPQALLRLQAHSWPGNVRELRHAIERASGLAGAFSPVLTEECFEFLLTPENVHRRPELELGSAVLSLDEMERVLLLKALRIAKGNRAHAARILGVARSTLFEKLKRHRILGPKTQEISLPAA